MNDGLKARGRADIEDLVIAARDGDQVAWAEIVKGFEDLIWRIARSYRLNDADVMDVCQTTWLKAATKLNTVREPARFAGWISTIADREAVNVLRRRKRESLRDDMNQIRSQIPEEGADQALLDKELTGIVNRAFLRLSIECRTLLSLVCGDPPMAYAAVSVKLAMPVGSIGPTRKRCLGKLRTLIEEPS